MSPRDAGDMKPSKTRGAKSLAAQGSQLLASLDSQLTILRGGSDEVRRLADELRTLVDEVRLALETASTNRA